MRRNPLIWIALIAGLCVLYLGVWLFVLLQRKAQTTAHLAWHRRLGQMDSGAPVQLDDGTLLAAATDESGNSFLYFIDPDGHPYIKHRLDYYYHGQWTGVGDRAYFTTTGELAAPEHEGLHVILTAVDENARELWQFPLEGRKVIDGIHTDGRQLYYLVDGLRLACVNLDGQLLWGKFADGGVFAALAANPAGGGYVLKTPPPPDDTSAQPSSIVPELIAFDAAGEVMWRCNISPPASWTRPSLSAGPPVLLAVTNANWLTAYRDGQPLWTYSAPPPPSRLAAHYPEPYDEPWLTEEDELLTRLAVSVDGAVYFTTRLGEVVALDRGGAERWRRHCGGRPGTPVLGRDGTLYVAVQERGLYAFRPGGRIKWRCTGYQAFGSDPVVGRDGRIYVASPTSLLAFEP
jgi:outer membrane protein assembly factor BamB